MCFFGVFFANFFAAFLAALSMQYKSVAGFGGVGWGSVKVFLRTACCCQKHK